MKSVAMLVTRTQLALPVAAAFLAMFGVMTLKERQASVAQSEKAEQDRKVCHKLQMISNAVVLLVIVTAGGQICYNFRMQRL